MVEVDRTLLARQCPYMSELLPETKVDDFAVYLECGSQIVEDRRLIFFREFVLGVAR